MGAYGFTDTIDIGRKGPPMREGRTANRAVAFWHGGRRLATPRVAQLVSVGQVHGGTPCCGRQRAGHDAARIGAAFMANEPRLG